jgi:HlyD family secretion protein
LWVLRDGKPAEVPVTTGASDGAWTEVTSGEIAPGTALIVDATPEES